MPLPCGWICEYDKIVARQKIIELANFVKMVHYLLILTKNTTDFVRQKLYLLSKDFQWGIIEDTAGI